MKYQSINQNRFIKRHNSRANIRALKYAIIVLLNSVPCTAASRINASHLSDCLTLCWPHSISASVVDLQPLLPCQLLPRDVDGAVATRKCFCCCQFLIRSFTEHMTACDLQNSFSVDTSVKITGHMYTLSDSRVNIAQLSSAIFSDIYEAFKI